MVGPIVGAGLRVGGMLARRTLAAEGAILGKAWWGFKSRREIVAGIRTGLGLGAGLGSFINDGSNPFDSGQTRIGTPSHKFSKKYSRRNISRGSSRRYNKCRPRSSRQFIRRRRY